MRPEQQNFPLFTVRQFLSWPSLVRGQPKVLAGGDALDRPIRWVHSSEVRDIAPLLKGGEVLLTTGLGLVGARATTQRRYIEALVEKNIAALVLEIGRFFSQVPPEMVTAARDHGLPLIVLERVVPFVAITEEASTHALNASRAFVEHYQECTNRLFAAINEDDPDAEVLAFLEAFCDGPVRFSFGAEEPSAAPNRCLVPIRYRGTVRLTADLPLMNDAVRQAAIAHACEHALPAWHRSRTSRPVDRVSSLIEFLMREESRSNADVIRRLCGVGLPVSKRHCCIPVVVEGHRGPEMLSDVVRSLTASMDLPAVAGTVANAAYVLLAVPQGAASWSQIEGVRQTLQQTLRCTGIAGTPCTAGDLSAALLRATALLRIAAAAGVKNGIVHIEQLSTASLLIDRSDADLAELSRPVEAIARQDAVKGTKYLATLDAFLDLGGHVSDVAAALGLTRQSLYKRLARISEVLGAPLSGPGRFETLRTAIAAAAILRARAATVSARHLER